MCLVNHMFEINNKACTRLISHIKLFMFFHFRTFNFLIVGGLLLMQHVVYLMHYGIEVCLNPVSGIWVYSRALAVIAINSLEREWDIHKHSYHRSQRYSSSSSVKLLTGQELSKPWPTSWMYVLIPDFMKINLYGRLWTTYKTTIIC